MRLYTPSHVSGKSSTGRVSISGLRATTHHLSFKSSLHVIKAPKIKTSKIKI